MTSYVAERREQRQKLNPGVGTIDCNLNWLMNQNIGK